MEKMDMHIEPPQQLLKTDSLFLKILKIIEKIKQNTFKIRTTISIARIEVEYLNSHIVKIIYIINKTIVLNNPNIKIISKTLA